MSLQVHFCSSPIKVFPRRHRTDISNTQKTKIKELDLLTGRYQFNYRKTSNTSRVQSKPGVHPVPTYYYYYYYYKCKD